MATLKTFFSARNRKRYHRIHTSVPPNPQTHNAPEGMHVVVVGRAQAPPPWEPPPPAEIPPYIPQPTPPATTPPPPDFRQMAGGYDASGPVVVAGPWAVLESVVVLHTVAAKPWRAPVARVQSMCMKLGLQRAAPVLLGRWWEGPVLVFFVDGAHDGPSWRMGGFSEFLGVRSTLARRLRAQSRQLVDLQSLAWGVRLAARLGYTTVTLVSDSEVAMAQFLQVSAKSVSVAQQAVLRWLAHRLVCSGIVVRVLWVPSGFPPADRMSRLQGEFGGDRLRVERMVWLVYEQLLRRPDKDPFRGVLCLGRGTDSGAA